MNKITHKIKQSFAILVIFMLVFSWFPVSIGAEESGNQKDYTALVDEAIENAVDYMIRDGVTSEWQAIGIYKAGKEVPASYTESFYNTFKSQVTEANRLKITDFERLIMAAQVIDIDPRDIDGTNLLAKVYNSENFKNDWVDEDYMTRQGNNGPIFALIALDSGGFNIPEDARWTREKLVEYLLEQQLDSGAWPLSGPSENIDITAMTIIALSNYTDNPHVQTAIDEAVSYLSKQQGKEGGFDVEFHGGISSESTSQVIIGLTSAGIDPTNVDFTKDGNNLMDHLLTFTTEDGGFKHVPGEKESNGMATEQALQALVAYKLFLNGDGKLYDLGKQDENKPTPEPEPNPTPETELVVIELGKEIDVSGFRTVQVKNSKTKIELPDDIPEGTELTITKPNEKDSPFKESGLELAGEWFNFNFSGNGDYTGTYKLTLGIDEKVDVNKADVYHFNEQRGDWELIEGEVNKENRTVTVKVNHFSTYGVFTKIESESIEGDKDSTNQNKDEDGNASTESPGESDNESTTVDDEPVEKDNEIPVSKVNKKLDEHNTSLVNIEGQKLPETATNTFNVMLTGLFIFILGLILLVIRKVIRN